jgi:acyl carrier protein
MDDDVELAIRAVLANVMASGMTAEDISTEADLVNEYGLDSLQMIAFLLGIEDTLDIELDYENLQLEHLRSVREVARFVAGLRVAAQ